MNEIVGTVRRIFDSVYQLIGMDRLVTDAVTVKSENDDEVHLISRGEMVQTLAAA